MPCQRSTRADVLTAWSMSPLGKSIAFRFGDPPPRTRRPAIFLDRDGVINQRIVGGYVTSWNEFRLLDGITAVLRELVRFRLPLIVVSNQAGVDKGLMSRANLADITERFVSRFARAGLIIAAVYYCPHSADAGCRCRKPRPGLLLQAARDWRIDLGHSVLIGDSPSDIEAARAAGCRSILLDPQDEFPAFRPANSKGPSRPVVITVRQVPDIPAQAAVLLERWLPQPPDVPVVQAGFRTASQ
jgi:D-glycero-D-manno-heptose 1,7-bisphosphate phosphatase